MLTLRRIGKVQKVSRKPSLVIFEAMALLVLALPLPAAAKVNWCFFCVKPVADMPVTLEKGTIRSPEFTVKHTQYSIGLQADHTIPNGQLECMMGIHNPIDPNHCGMFGFQVAVDFEWKLYANGQVVAQGKVQGMDYDVGFDSHHTTRYFATFMGEKKKKYVFEVTFLKDGTALRVANPHIVVDLTPSMAM